METTLVAPHCAGTSRICGKIKKSNVLHYICHFTSDKNNFLHSWLFFSLTWAENEHWQPLVALRPLEAVKSFISCPCDTGKQPLIPKIVSDTGKMTNEWSKVLFHPHNYWRSCKILGFLATIFSLFQVSSRVWCWRLTDALFFYGSSGSITVICFLKI